MQTIAAAPPDEETEVELRGRAGAQWKPQSHFTSLPLT
jgi:hypothetical protein